MHPVAFFSFIMEFFSFSFFARNHFLFQTHFRKMVKSMFTFSNEQEAIAFALESSSDGGLLVVNCWPSRMFQAGVRGIESLPLSVRTLESGMAKMSMLFGLFRCLGYIG